MPDSPAPPHSVEAEQAVLGGLLLDPTAFPRVEGLGAQDFYRGDHRLIFAAIADLAGAGKTFDVVLVEDELKRRRQLQEVGGLSYLGTLARNTPGVGNLEGYVETVLDYALRRKLHAIGSEVAREAYGGTTDARGVLIHAQERLLSLQMSARTGTGLISTREHASAFIDDLDIRRERPRGLETGLTDFDELTHGLEGGDLVVIAGRPGMGKTALLVSVAAYVARHHGVAVFSAEMSARQLMRRCAALLCRIPQDRLRRADLLTAADWDSISRATSDLAQRRLWIDDTAAPALMHIRAESLALKARQGLGIVIVDYLQLVRGEGKNRYEELREVAYGLKALAKDLAVPVIALAQLNRGVESREDKRPSASDLRDSGAIEEAADIIGLLYSQGYYDPGFSMPDVLECRIGKHRNGERGECLWSFIGQHSRITVLDDADRRQYRHLLAERNKSLRRAANDL